MLWIWILPQNFGSTEVNYIKFLLIHKFYLFNLLQIREDILVIAGTLENVDLNRFRKGQIRRVKNEVVHPKWERDDAGKKVTTRYFDVGLLFLTEVGKLNICMYVGSLINVLYL